jgi:hypothetical protein
MKTYVWEYLNSTVASLFKNRGGGGIESIQPGTGVNIDDSDPSNPIINVVGDGSSSLQDVTDLGNTTTNDINFSGDSVGLLFDNGAKFQKGTTDAGLGGYKGVAQICSINYELKWEAGRLFYIEQDGFTIREVTHNFTQIPSQNDDASKGFVIGSRWVLDDGKVYLCSDNTNGNAIWEYVLPPYIPLTGTDKDKVTGNIQVATDKNGLISLEYNNGDIIGLGVDYGGYSAISFYNAGVNQTVYLYNRGGDLYIENVDTGEGTGALITQILNLNATKFNYIDGFNLGQTPPAVFNTIAKGIDSKQYLVNGSGTYKGLTKLPSHYFIDSCSYSQIGTGAPFEKAVFETQVGSGIVTKQLSYVSVGTYNIKYFMLESQSYVPQADKIKIISSGGEEPHVCISQTIAFTQEVIGGFTYDVVTITIFTRQPSNSNLANDHLTASPIDVYFYE